MLYNGDCGSCEWRDDGVCNCQRSRYYRYWLAVIVPPRCEFYSRRPEPLPAIGGGLEEPGEGESDD